jgi:hypothetical protein
VLAAVRNFNTIEIVGLAHAAHLWHPGSVRFHV